MPNSVTLLNAPLNSWLVVKSLQGPPAVCKRLAEMGFAPGEKILIQQRMPWAGPVVVSMQDASFALRTQEAECLILD
jgi:Fe2+ transport system protein FeoA